VAGDDGKMAWQQSDNTFWLLTDFSGPTWLQFGADGATGPTGPAGESGAPDPSGTVTAVSATSVAEGTGRFSAVTFTLTNVVVNVVNPGDYGSIELGSMGDRFWAYLGATMDFTADKDGVNILDTTDLYFGMGTSTNTGFPIAAQAENLWHQTLYNATEDPVTVQQQEPRESANGTTLLTTLPDFFAANESIYLTVAATPLSTDGTVTLNGTITLYILDMGPGF
jgi:hypothetical protein